MKVTQKLLKELFDYKDDGNLYWKIKPKKGAMVGSLAGTIWTGKNRKTSYRIIRIYGKNYRAHRLVWLLHFGQWPGAILDHKDGNGLNNKLDNLREATLHDNMHNVSKSKANTSGFKGVYYDKINKKWVAAISINGRMKNLGRYTTPEEVSTVYNNTAKQLHGEFYKET